MMRPTVDGIASRMVTSARLSTRVLTSGPDNGVPVLFLHGNLSSATWWEEAMATLPPGFRGIAPDQRGFGDAAHEAKVDATRGLRDFADDAAALLDTLGVGKTHVIGESLGGSVLWHMLMEYADRLLSLTLAAPGSPFGACGTRDALGTPCFEDFAGSGGGLISRQFVQNLRSGDRSTTDLFSPRSALRTIVFRPPFIPKREEALLSSMLFVHLGDRDFPGDWTTSPHWPYVAPGAWGATNALSPKYVGDIARLTKLDPKPAILWIRGSDDLAVSDSATSDPGQLGKLGLIPRWPGNDIYPPQPTLLQTRDVLNRYAAAGGNYREVVINECGHVPFIEKLDESNRAFHATLRANP